MPNGEREVEYTDMQVQELSLLRKYPVKQPEMIVNYVTTQGETVPEDPEIMPPLRRRQVLKRRRGVKPT